jgi:hypothetical protein
MKKLTEDELQKNQPNYIYRIHKDLRFIKKLIEIILWIILGGGGIILLFYIMSLI